MILTQQGAWADRLIVAAGSRLSTPNIPGLKEFSFDVDSYQGAKKLQKHIELLPTKKSAGRFTIVVAGGGFTGVEAAEPLFKSIKC